MYLRVSWSTHRLGQLHIARGSYREDINRPLASFFLADLPSTQVLHQRIPVIHQMLSKFVHLSLLSLTLCSVTAEPLSYPRDIALRAAANVEKRAFTNSQWTFYQVGL